MKTLQDIAVESMGIIEQHQEAAEYDAGFDAGEFSGPAHDRMANKKIDALAKDHGFTIDQVYDEMYKMFNSPE